MTQGTVWLDKRLKIPETEADVRVRDFRGRAGPRNAAIYSLLTFVRETNVIPTQALLGTVKESSIEEYVPDTLLTEFE
jgi:hypothetical protein